MGEGLKRIAKMYGGITTISKEGKVNHLKVKMEKMVEKKVKEYREQKPSTKTEFDGCIKKMKGGQ